MSVHTWHAILTATSSVAHGGEVLGTVTYLRREAVWTPHGRINVPIVSGNSLRGILRNISADLTWRALGQPDLPVAVAHALWSGGALVKAKAQPLTGQRLAHLRATVAHVGLFGAAGGGRIIDGALMVGKVVPICTQTTHLLPEAVTAHDELPDLHDLLQIEYYSRVPDHTATRAATGTTPDADTADPDDDTPAGLLMRYGTETFTAGTRFHTTFTLKHPTVAEQGLFADTLTTWLAHPTIGGRTGRGHGHLAVSFDQPLPATGTWDTFNHTPASDVLTALSWLD